MIDQFDIFDKNLDPNIFNIMEYILSYTRKWEFDNNSGCPWFRGQDCSSAPLPSVFREDYDEFHLNTTFRNRVASLSIVPETRRLDMWLFLMQHYGSPTRLLDWTESLLNALFFALDSYNELCECKKIIGPSIWAIHPLKLNEYSKIRGDFPNTWTCNNLGREYFRLGFHPIIEWKNEFKVEKMRYPIAIQANHMDMRIFAQQSCFTIHGTDNRNFELMFEDTDLAKNNYFLKFIIPHKYAEGLLSELNKIGINKSKVYPDLEHFALDLKKRFKAKK